MATAADIRALLEHTTLPSDVVGRLVDGAPKVWLASNAADALAADLVLFHPPLHDTEVRARAAPYADTGWRLTVVTHDRPGLLADTAAALASKSFSIASASVGTWTNLHVALHTLTIDGPLPTEDVWATLGRRLRDIEVTGPADVSYEPRGEAIVDVTTDDEKRWLVRVRAADQVGLLWAICSELAAQGVGILAASVESRDGAADDLFVVDSPPHLEALRQRLA